MEESKWLCTLSVKKDDCCRGSWQYQQFKAFLWQYIEGPITPWYDTPDLNLSVWRQAIFSQFAFLLSWQMKSGSSFYKQRNAWSERHLPPSKATLAWLLFFTSYFKGWAFWKNILQKWLTIYTEKSC